MENLPGSGAAIATVRRHVAASLLPPSIHPGSRALLRCRRALLPVAVATTLALVAYLWGQSVADAALAHVVPW